MGVGAVRGKEDGETNMTRNSPPLLKRLAVTWCQSIVELQDDGGTGLLGLGSW